MEKFNVGVARFLQEEASRSKDETTIKSIDSKRSTSLMTTEIRLQPSANNSGGVDLDFEGIRHGNDENEAEEKIIVRG